MNGILLTESGAMTKVLGVVPQIIELATTCFGALLENEVTLVYVGAGFVGLGFGIFTMMRRSARGR